MSRLLRLLALPPRIGWSFLVKPRGRLSHPWYRGIAARRRESRSGVALMVVLGAILVMTVLVTEMNYGARVRVLMASHQRDEAQAYWLARTGVNLTRLLLIVNNQINANTTIKSYMSALGMGELWQMIPFVSSALLRMFLVGGGSGSDFEEGEVSQMAQTGTVSEEVAAKSRELSRFSDKGFLDFEGDFSAQIEDEDRRVNLAFFKNRPADMPCADFVTSKLLYGLMSGEENDQWFNERNIDRWDIICNLADWVDSDTTRSGLSGGTEDDLYNRLDSPYLSRNAPFETKEEIRLVDGWQDDIYDRFGSELTVWGQGRININSASDEVIAGLLRTYLMNADHSSQLEILLSYLSECKAETGYFANPAAFKNCLQEKGASFKDEAGLEQAITTTSSTFRVTSLGVVGDTTVTLTAIIDYSAVNAGQSTNMSGRILHWHID